MTGRTLPGDDDDDLYDQDPFHDAFEYQSHDPSRTLSVANAVIGLIAASIQIYYDVFDTAGELDPIDRVLLRAPITALKGFKPSIQLIYKFFRRFENRELALAHRAELLSLDMIIIATSEAALALSELGFTLHDIVHMSHTQGMKLKTAVERCSTRLTQASERISTCERIMTKILIVLQISVEAEARQHLAGIETSLVKILDTNPPLAERLNSMRDIFGARALVPEERLEAALDREPPRYSVPADNRSQSTLPDYTARTASGAHTDGSVTIQATSRTIFSGLTLGDVSILSLLPLPIVCDELRYGPEFYTFEYSRLVNDSLSALAEKNVREKAKQMCTILGLRPWGSVAEDSENFAKNVNGGVRVAFSGATTRGLSF